MRPAFPDTLILAGGFGTRLQSVVSDLPKPLAPVAGKPFLTWLLEYLHTFSPGRFILCTGYKHEQIEAEYGTEFLGIPMVYSVETEPLGTGGAIKQGLSQVRSEQALILNGDTLLLLDYIKFYAFHLDNGNDFTMALRSVDHPDRYGTVDMSGNRITRFNEKDPDLSHGNINAGVYLMDRKAFSWLPEAEKFSFEKDFLEASAGNRPLSGFVCEDYFIDIGIPDDYQKANHEFPKLFHH